MYLTTERCVIRNFLEEDAPQLFEVLSDPDVMEYIEPPFTAEQTKKFISDAGLCAPPLVYALVWKETNSVIGHVIYHPYEEKSFEIGWILRKDFWGRGIADEVTGALIDRAKSSGTASCVIECDPAQDTTRHIALKHSFVYEGQDDGCDVYRLTFNNLSPEDGIE